MRVFASRTRRVHAATVAVVFVAASVAFVAPRAMAQDRSGLAKLMSPEEYSRSGLAKLSDEERAALDAWFARFQAGELQAARTEAVVAAVEEAREEVREARAAERIEARIVGPFAGWSGSTVFRLDNGQVWRQRLPGRYKHEGGDSPDVVISRNALGFYVLTVTASGRRTGVEKLH